ncbi:hypothetical protein FACS1894182_07420 [Bacteroidia bacterium]|nr:hypothetical protein FACS1894182_07420 [Bacteroidia bacterium]
MKNNLLISVLIPTYNCAKYIRQAIDSILAQGYDNLEIVVADDGSTDDTVCIIETLRDTTSLIKYFHKPNGGIADTRNFLIEHASGDLWAWVDADDFWAAGKLAAQLKYLDENPDCEIVFTKFENFFEYEELKNHPRFQHEITYAERTSFHFTTALMKPSVFEKTGNFMLTTGEDLEIVSRMMISGVNVNHCLPAIYYYRRLHGINSIITMDYSVKNVIYPNLIRNLRKNIDKANSLNIPK